jgi:hypothetical protein
MVVSVDFRIVVVSPIGDTTVPLEVDPLELVTTPLTVELRWLLVSVDVTGSGRTGVVVVWVVVELEDEDCAKATPVIKATAMVAASKAFIISVSPRNSMRAAIGRSPAI